MAQRHVRKATKEAVESAEAAIQGRPSRAVVMIEMVRAGSASSKKTRRQTQEVVNEVLQYVIGRGYRHVEASESFHGVTLTFERDDS